MKNITKKLTSLLLAMLMLVTMSLTAFAGIGVDVESAYNECAEIYPEFVDAIIAKGGTEAQIIAFLEDVQSYLLGLDVEITEDNFEDYFVEAIIEMLAKRSHMKLRDALAAAFPEAVVDGMDGIIHEDFVPIVETVKVILFGGGEVEEPTEETEPTTEDTPIVPTEPPTEDKPVENPTEEPTEGKTEAEADKPSAGNTGNGSAGNGSVDYDDAEEGTPTEEPTQPKIQFSDMKQAEWAEQAVNALVKIGVINGYPDGTFRPNNPVTRAEFAKMITIASGRYLPQKEQYTSTFEDVKVTDWSYSYVSAALKFGFITGRSATIFDPNSNITRADLCLIVYRYVKSINPEFKAKTDANGQIVMFADAMNLPSWTKEAVEVLYSNGIAPVRDTVNNKFEPTLPATRAECAYIVHNAINAALGLK